ncbi:MAG: hypothetical protein ACREA2_15760 [Blastocatellia bacterium]
MKPAKKKQPESENEFESFEDLAKKLMAVPKTEIDEKAAEVKKAKQAKKAKRKK